MDKRVVSDLVPDFVQLRFCHILSVDKYCFEMLFEQGGSANTLAKKSSLLPACCEQTTTTSNAKNHPNEITWYISVTAQCKIDLLFSNLILFCQRAMRCIHSFPSRSTSVEVAGCRCILCSTMLNSLGCFVSAYESPGPYTRQRVICRITPGCTDKYQVAC